MARPVAAPSGKHKDFALRFRQAAEWAGLPSSYRDRAKRLGISTVFYGELNRGEKLPSADKGSQIAQKLGVSYEWLVTGRGAMIVGTSDGIVDISHLSDDARKAVLAVIKSLESSS